jgi:hypothetical protein
MNITFMVKVKSTGEITKEYDEIMDKCGIDPRMGFENIGIQSDGTAVVFDKCGNFGYLSGEFELVIAIEEE